MSQSDICKLLQLRHFFEKIRTQFTVGDFHNLPNWYISPADIITPTLPNVSANT